MKYAVSPVRIILLGGNLSLGLQSLEPDENEFTSVVEELLDEKEECAVDMVRRVAGYEYRNTQAVITFNLESSTIPCKAVFTVRSPFA